MVRHGQQRDKVVVYRFFRHRACPVPVSNSGLPLFDFVQHSEVYRQATLLLCPPVPNRGAVIS